MELDQIFIYSGDFGEKVIGNLVNYDKFCTACDPACSSCRFGQFNWSSDIKQAMVMPGPDELQPGQDSGFGLGEPEGEVAWLVDVHPDVMLEFSESLEGSRVKAVVVPIEGPGVGLGLVRQLQSILDGFGIELAAPKPSCSLDPPQTLPVMRELVATYKIGKPVVEVETDTSRAGETTITKAKVLRSAPCGATWYICQRLQGVPVDPQAVADAISKAHHAYPCTASMATDREIGDTFLHRAGCIARETVMEAVASHLDGRGLADEAEMMRIKAAEAPDPLTA
jgi:hypothetical protein